MYFKTIFIIIKNKLLIKVLSHLKKILTDLQYFWATLSRLVHIRVDKQQVGYRVPNLLEHQW